MANEYAPPVPAVVVTGVPELSSTALPLLVSSRSTVPAGIAPPPLSVTVPEMLEVTSANHVCTIAAAVPSLATCTVSDVTGTVGRNQPAAPAEAAPAPVSEAAAGFHPGTPVCAPPHVEGRGVVAVQ